MMKIKIKNLRLNSILGIYDFEQSQKREIIINATLEYANDAVLVSCDIEDALDYAKISAKIKNFVEGQKFALIETLADELLDLLLADQDIKNIELEVDKPGALDDADSCSVIMSRSQ